MDIWLATPHEVPGQRAGASQLEIASGWGVSASYSVRTLICYQCTSFHPSLVYFGVLVGQPEMPSGVTERLWIMIGKLPARPPSVTLHSPCTGRTPSKTGCATGVQLEVWTCHCWIDSKDKFERVWGQHQFGGQGLKNPSPRAIVFKYGLAPFITFSPRLQVSTIAIIMPMRQAHTPGWVLGLRAPGLTPSAPKQWKTGSTMFMWTVKIPCLSARDSTDKIQEKRNDRKCTI